MLRIDFDFDKLTAQLDGFAEVVEGAIRSAAQAGAQVYYDEMKLRAARSDSGEGKGLLARSIFQKYSPESSLPGVKATYHISWNKGKGKATPFAGHGQLIEYGWVQRYAVRTAKNGQWFTVKKKGVKGKVPPYKGSRNPAARQAYYDQFYKLRPGGPVQHAPRSFLRASFEAKQQEAFDAANKEMQERILKAFI